MQDLSTLKTTKCFQEKFSETEINGESVSMVGGLEAWSADPVLSQSPSPRASCRNWQAGICHLCANAKDPDGPEQPRERRKWGAFPPDSGLPAKPQ